MGAALQSWQPKGRCIAAMAAPGALPCSNRLREHLACHWCSPAALWQQQRGALACWPCLMRCLCLMLRLPISRGYVQSTALTLSNCAHTQQLRSHSVIALTSRPPAPCVPRCRGGCQEEQDAEQGVKGAAQQADGRRPPICGTHCLGSRAGCWQWQRGSCCGGGSGGVLAPGLTSKQPAAWRCLGSCSDRPGTL